MFESAERGQVTRVEEQGEGYCEDDHLTGGSATARLVLDSRPECVSLVRAMLAGVGERLELDHGLLDDLKTAVSEACNNVVLHAYGSRRGPLSVQLKVGESAVEAAVCDRGGGFRTVVDEARMGLGLPVIGALADRVEFLRVPGGGT